MSLKWDASDRSFGLSLDALLSLGSAIPVAKEEAALLDLCLELLPGIYAADVAIAHSLSLVEDVLLNLVKECSYTLYDALLWEALLLKRVTTNELESTVLEVTCTNGDTYRYALELILRELEAWALVVSIVVLNADALSAKRVDPWLNTLCKSCELIRLIIDRYNYDLNWSKLWRKDETVVIRVSHDESTDKTC